MDGDKPATFVIRSVHVSPDSATPKQDGDKPATFVIRSGWGYFIRFDNGAPYMTTDPVEASRFGLVHATNIKSRLEGAGYAAELVEVRYAGRRANRS